MNDQHSYHMTPEEFRTTGHALVNWIADYQQRVEEYPVLSRAAPGSVRASLPAEAPEQGEAFDTVLADIDRVILPGVTHWQSPNFYAYFPANTSGPSILGDLLSSGLGVQGMLWVTSPACTELESHMLDWLVGMLGLPESFRSGKGGGVIQDSASSANLTALLAARERATQFRTREQGVRGNLTAYASSQAHSSIEKAMMVAGMGREHLRLVDVDADFAMRPDDLRRQIERDLEEGNTPVAVVATMGTTSSTAMDPLPEIGAICREYGIWLHVDGAHAGTAALCPEFRWIQDGLELADSYVFDAHKWMFTNFDCSCFFVADHEPLVRALSVLPEYLRNQASQGGAVIDYRDWHVPLGRRFRALKLWFVIRHYGVEGLRHHVRRHVECAQEFAAWVRADPDFELAAPAPLNLVCFRHRGGDAINQEIQRRVNESGKLYITHTRLDGKHTLRICIGQTHTELHHVKAAWQAIRDAALG